MILILKVIMIMDIEAIVSRSSMQSNHHTSQHMFRLPDYESAVFRPFLPEAGYTAEQGLGTLGSADTKHLSCKPAI